MDKKAEKRLENEALFEFLQLTQTPGGLGNHVKTAIREELTKRQQELIELHYLEGRSITEISQLLEVNPSTVSRTLKRGRERIRKYFKYNGRILANSLVE